MATRIEEILVRARDTLTDPLKERWDDARLLRLLDEGQKVLATKARLLRSNVPVPLAAGVFEYTLPPSVSPSVSVINTAGQPVVVTSTSLQYALPNNIFSFTRAVNELGDPILLLSHAHADNRYGRNWEAKTGPTVQAIIFDKQDQTKFRVYPIPDETVVGSTTTQLATLNSLYGITVAGGLSSTYDLVSSPYGVMTGVAQISNTSFTIYYIRYPAVITAVTDNLEIHEAYDVALKFYICGMALRDDKDVQNRSLGNEELQLFREKLADAITESSLDFSSESTKYEVPYFGGI